MLLCAIVYNINLETLEEQKLSTKFLTLHS